VYAASRELNARYKRLDVLICNAGIGGWEGIDWLVVLKQFFTQGLTAIMSRPAYKRGTLGSATATQVQNIAEGNENGGEEEPKLGEVFCANVFGHYLLVHETMGLLSRNQGVEGLERGRVVWLSTIEALESKFDAGDIQGMKTTAAYESSKRLSDVLFLSSSLPETQKWVKTYTQPTNAASTIAPKMYTCHPGIFASSIMPIYPILVYAQLFAFLLVRLVGSLPWLVVTADRGATAPVWLALEDAPVLDEEKADKRKWGSCVFGWGQSEVLETEVEGLASQSFGKMAGGLWEQMEGLREEWEERCKGK
jgi:3-keto steroid reductase